MKSTKLANYHDELLVTGGLTYIRKYDPNRNIARKISHAVSSSGKNQTDAITRCKAHQTKPPRSCREISIKFSIYL